jgi:transcriptional regulator with XRE-family HTH domain
MVETIGIRIEYLREKIFNLSQEEFAKKLGVSQRTISGMENSEVSAKNILKLESLGVNRFWLETGEGNWNDVGLQKPAESKGKDVDMFELLKQQLKEKDKQIENLTTLLLNINRQQPTSQMVAR